MSNHQKDEELRWQKLRERLTNADQPSVPDNLLHLARAVAGAEDPDMTCDECQSWLPSYVDDEVGGLAVGELYPEVKRHLDLCAECEAIYLETLELALAEEAGELPIPEQLPEPDLEFLPPLSHPDVVSFPDYVRTLAEEITSVITPERVTDLREIADVFFERVAALGGRFRLEAGFAPALGLGAGGVFEVLETLAATYATTQALIETLSVSEVDVQLKTGQLPETLRHQAEMTAQALGLSPQQTADFVQQYVESVSRDPIPLQELIKLSAR